jgi:FAD/FMN-containing dehydrogenase
MQRSYGDSALNNGGTLMDMTGLDRVHVFDVETGILRADAGCVLGDLYHLTVPRGWFLPVVPGTQYVTLGGAVANDIHGKNHHRMGSFGCHVRAIGLQRNDGQGMVTREEAGDLFYATIGGLGLTGVITWVEVQCTRVPSAFVDVQNTIVQHVAGAVDVLSLHDETHEFTVAWIDTIHGRGRGVVHSGNWSNTHPSLDLGRSHGGVPIAVDAPNWLVGRWSVSIFNTLWYARHKLGSTKVIVPIQPFFHPLDMLRNWNRLYGRRGMVQYQCVVPSEAGVEQGLTLALDFPNTGSDVLALLNRCDDVVRAAKGRVYVAKDCRLPGATFRSMYPQWENFQAFIDPKMSSTWWRRVMQT